MLCINWQVSYLVPATSHTYAAKYLLSSLSTGTNANYPPPPPFPVYSTDFYNASNSSELPLLPPPPPPPNWSYLEGTRVSTQTPHHQKKKWSPVAESSAPIHHPYQKYPDPSPQQKERRHRKQPHELLSESQKKANHIASEQKRRQNIRIGFDQLIDIVPSLNHGNRSEALILQKCRYILEKSVCKLLIIIWNSCGSYSTFNLIKERTQEPGARFTRNVRWNVGE